MNKQLILLQNKSNMFDYKWNWSQSHKIILKFFSKKENVFKLCLNTLEET